MINLPPWACGLCLQTARCLQVKICHNSPTDPLTYNAPFLRLVEFTWARSLSPQAMPNLESRLHRFRLMFQDNSRPLAQPQKALD